MPKTNKKAEPTPYIRYSSLTLIGLFGVFAGLLAIAAVLEAVTWEFVSEWLVKIGLVTLILLAISVFVGFIVTITRK